MIIGCATSLENASWETIAEKEAYDIDEINFKQKGDKNSVVASAILRSARFFIKDLEALIQSESFDPVLWELYISYNLSVGQINDQLKSLIIEFSENESDNALPLYFLSCYYLSKNELSKSIKALREGNKRKKCNLYIFDKKKHVFEYLMSVTDHELTAYISQFSVHNSEVFTSIRDIVQKFCKPAQIDDVRIDIIKMGEKIENCSVDVIEKYFSLSLQASCLNNDFNPKRLEAIKKKREYFQALLKKGENRYGYEKLMRYLKTAFFKGEIVSLEEL